MRTTGEEEQARGAEGWDGGESDLFEGLVHEEKQKTASIVRMIFKIGLRIE